MKLPFFNESLNAFLAVAAERSFSAAAKKLGVTQSAVTKAVARLEKELEVELFDRGCRPVMLTLKTVESTLSQIRRRRARGTSGLWPSSP